MPSKRRSCSSESYQIRSFRAEDDVLLDMNINGYNNNSRFVGRFSSVSRIIEFKNQYEALSNDEYHLHFRIISLRRSKKITEFPSSPKFSKELNYTCIIDEQSRFMKIGALHYNFSRFDLSIFE